MEELLPETNASFIKPSSYHFFACQYDRQPESWDHNTRGEEVCEFPARIARGISVVSEPGGDEVWQRRDHVENEHEQRPIDSIKSKHTHSQKLNKIKKSHLPGHCTQTDRRWHTRTAPTHSPKAERSVQGHHWRTNWPELKQEVYHLKKKKTQNINIHIIMTFDG